MGEWIQMLFTGTTLMDIFKLMVVIGLGIYLYKINVYPKIIQDHGFNEPPFYIRVSILFLLVTWSAPYFSDSSFDLVRYLAFKLASFKRLTFAYYAISTSWDYRRRFIQIKADSKYSNWANRVLLISIGTSVVMIILPWYTRFSS